MALVLESTRVVVDGQVKPARVFIENGIITAVDTEFSRELPESGVQNYGDAVIMAGLVDSHVHINAPGHREQWEGFPTATKAAAAGGITTVVDMPLNCSPVTTTREALKAKVDHAVDKIWVDVACLGGIVPDHIGEISGLIADGVVGFKAFMVHSGIDDFPHVEEEHIHAAMQELKKVKETTGKDIVFMFHAEVGGPIDEASQRCGSCPPQKYHTFLESRPKSAENQAIATVIRLSEQYQVRTHIVHLSSSEAVEMIREARARGVPITAETTFHYLHFRAEQVPDGATHFKCCPPIREEANRERLWTALADGDIQMVISDHSPCTPDLKLLEQGDFMKAWGGISSLQLGLSIIWTDAKARGFSIPDVARWVCQATAELVGLGKRKGRLAEGYDGDVVVWNPEGTFKVEAEGLRVRNKLSPYEGEELAGCVQATFLRGQKIFDSSCPSLLEEIRAGQLLFS